MPSPLAYLILLMLVAPPFSRCFDDSRRKELRVKLVDNQTIVQLGSSITAARVDPSRVVRLSWRPRVFLYKGFLTNDECDHLISLAQGTKETSVEKGDDSRKLLKSWPLASSESVVNKDDNILKRIEERISAWTLLPKDYGMPLKVMHYGFEEAKHSFDYFGNKSKLILNQPLMATLVFYLSNATRGGEILFPQSEVKSKIQSDCAKGSSFVKPVKGNAILFFTVHLNASPDRSSRHARCPVIEGDMWCATKLFHIRPIDGAKPLVESDRTECTDEDENCSVWAALGECQRNPVYMIGSPDYYGTCRKSCNAC